MADGRSMTPRVVPTPHTSERDFQRDVESSAKLFGWETCHVAPGMTLRGKWTTPTSVPGWPDLMLYRPGEFLMAELKVDDGKLSKEQVAVIAALRAAGETMPWIARGGARRACSR